MKKILVIVFAALFLAGCSTAPLDDLADNVVEAETREERTTRLYGFATVASDFAVGSATRDDIPRVLAFMTRLLTVLDEFDADPDGLWTESNIMSMVRVFGTSAHGKFADLMAGGIPSLSQMTEYIGPVASASAMLRDVSWIMGQVAAGNMTNEGARQAFRKRIAKEVEWLNRANATIVSPDSVSPDWVLPL